MSDDERWEQWVSPCGQRTACIDRTTGETWYSYRLGPAEAADLALLLPRWHPAANSRDQGRTAPSRGHLTLV